MSWNYRLVSFPGMFGNVGLCEVHYDESGKPRSRTDPVKLIGDLPDDIKEDMALMQQAFDKPILDAAEDFS